MEYQGEQFLVGDPKSSSLLFLSKGGGSDSEVKPGPRFVAQDLIHLIEASICQASSTSQS